MTPACEPFADDLSAFIDGELATDRAAQVEQHVAACDDCRSTVESLRRVSSGLAALPRERASGDLLAAVRRDVRGGKGEDSGRAPGSSFAGVSQPMILRGFAAAALIVIGVFVSSSLFRSTSSPDGPPTLVHAPASKPERERLEGKAAAQHEWDDRKQEIDASAGRALRSPGYLADAGSATSDADDEAPIDAMRRGATIRLAPSGDSVLTITVAPRDEAEYHAVLAVLAAARVERNANGSADILSRDKDAIIARRTAGLEHVKSGRFEMLMVSAETADRLIVSFEQAAPRQVSVEKSVADARGLEGQFYFDQTTTPAARAIVRSKETTTDELTVAGAPARRSRAAPPAQPEARAQRDRSGLAPSEAASRRGLGAGRRNAAGIGGDGRASKSESAKDDAARKLKDRSVANAPAREQARENIPGSRVGMLPRTAQRGFSKRSKQPESAGTAASQPQPPPSSAPTVSRTPATSQATLGEVRLRIRIMPPPGVVPPAEEDTTDSGGK